VQKLKGYRRGPFGKWSLLLFVAVTVLIQTNLVHATTVTLAWDASTSPGITGYKIYVGTASGTYVQIVDVGNVLTYAVTGLDEGVRYFFVATAYTDTLESGYSNEVNTSSYDYAPEAPEDFNQR
jgi:hypothetical protein